MTSRSSKSNGNNKAYQNNRTLNNLMIGDFKIGLKLGQGTFSKVCQGTHMPTGEKVAIKIMSKDQIKEKSDQIRIEKEINIQKKLHHQNIVQQYAIIETQTTIYIISEYCSGGELFDYIVSKRKLYEVEACRIYQQLISGLEYLHKQRICHRDLKPENLLFDSKHILKIADFGLSNDYHKGKLSTPCGSPCYAAPEMVTGKKYSGSSVDIWSSGIVLYTMVCGFLPFEDDNQNILFGKIAKGLFSLPSFLSSSCKDLLKKILVTDPKKRYGFEEIKHHPWFMSVNNVMGKNIFFNSPGVFVDEDVIPIDIEIIAEMFNDFHIDIAKIILDVLKNRHNKITTTYYLILKRKVRNNENSVSDISSNSTSFIKYIKSSISKMGYWNSDYEKITQYYVKLVKKFLNSISEENSMSYESKGKNNGNNSSNKENTNANNIKTTTTNTDKITLNQIVSNPKSNNDYHCYTELDNNSNQNNNLNNKNQYNNSMLNNPIQNGGVDIIINTLYDDKINNIPKIPINTLIEKNNEDLNKVDYAMDLEEPSTNKINETYKPKKTIQEFLQTDTNNIKMNNILIKEKNNLEKLKLNNINNNINNNVLISEESTIIPNNKNIYEQKDTAMPDAERILLTEMDNVDINNLQNSLLNKNNDKPTNKNKLNYNKNIPIYKSKNNKIKDYIRMNTLYNRDDSYDNIKSNSNDITNDQNDNNHNINERIKTAPPNKDKNKNFDEDKNKDLSKAINGLNENNYINNNNHNRSKSIEKKAEDLKIYNNNQNKDKTNKFPFNIVSLPFTNQLYKRINNEKQEKILKFINQKNSSMPKKEDIRKENLDLENGRLLLLNKNKFKNRFSQEHNSFQNNHINNGLQTRANGSNEINIMNRNINNNLNDILNIKKRKRPKSIDDNTNNKLYTKENVKNNMNDNSFNRKDSKNNVNTNELYSKINYNNKKNMYKNIIHDKKYIDEPYIDSFRYNNLNKKHNITKLNKKIEINDFKNITNISNKRNNNYFIEKMKNRENYMILNKEEKNYTNILINKNKLHEHNSFDIPKNIKTKLNGNYINNSTEKVNKNPNNNIQQFNNNNYYKLNNRMKHYYRNVNNKPNIGVTQYYRINNYNIDNFEKLSNEKYLLNKRINNYRVIDKIKSNSVDLSNNQTKEVNEIKSKYNNKRKFYLNTSVIKDKTPKKLITAFLYDKSKQNKYINKKNIYYINTMENSNYLNTTNNNNQNVDEGRYLTFKDNENTNITSTRANHFPGYLFPGHKRYNFSQEPEKKKKENEVLKIFTAYGKGNSFILSKPNNFLFNKDKNINKIEYKKYNLNQINNKNNINEKQKYIINESKNNGNNMNIYCKKSIDKIKECIEKITGNKVNLTKHKNSSLKHLECKYKEGNNIVNFILNISKSSGKTDYFIITPSLIKGNSNTYRLIFEKIKNKLT